MRFLCSGIRAKCQVCLGRMRMILSREATGTNSIWFLRISGMLCHFGNPAGGAGEFAGSWFSQDPETRAITVRQKTYAGKIKTVQVRSKVSGDEKAITWYGGPDSLLIWWCPTGRFRWIS